MPFWPTHWLYRRLGRHYPSVILALQLMIGVTTTGGALILFGSYYEVSWNDKLLTLAVAETAVVGGLIWSYLRAKPRLEAVRAWMGGDRRPSTALSAWDAAVNLPVQVFKHDAPKPSLCVCVVSSVAAVVALDLNWLTIVPLFAGAAIATAYTAILQYFAIETAMRPVVLDVNDHLPEDFAFERLGVPLKYKLLSILPLINVVTGLVVATVTSGEGSSLGLSVLAATAVAFTLSLELSVLLAASLLRPIWSLRDGLASVRGGRYDIRVPVTTSDELGELSDGFNQMAAGLEERERLREAFGTYLDREVAEYILSTGFDESGQQVEVSILFCDVVGFTRFASEAEPAEVVARLNELFEAIVPIIARHGGHVDKFIGDGLLAVFGAPEPHDDHADRALAAGCDVVRTVNDGAAGDLRVGIGINSGPVVAGSIGGAGRLNFSVIGDAVNVAARVESATRETGDDLLITANTRELLRSPLPLVSRGGVDLRGKDQPVELFAVASVADDRSAAEPAVTATRV